MTDRVNTRREQASHGGEHDPAKLNVILSAEEQAGLHRVIDNPGAPTGALRALLSGYQQFTAGNQNW